jgi:hypothetical protein
LAWPAASGKLYQIQQSADLLHWTNLGDPMKGADATLSAPVTPSGAAIFYRVQESDLPDYYNGQAPTVSLTSSVPSVFPPRSMSSTPVTIQIRLASGAIAPGAPLSVSLLT